MKIVIDIPERYYEMVKDFETVNLSRCNYKTVQFQIINAIKNGTLLQTGEWLEKEVYSEKVIDEWQSAKCSKCERYHTTPYMYSFKEYEFCPHCGARMKEDK